MTPLGSAEAIATVCESFDIHTFRVFRTNEGLLLEADRYGYRVAREISTKELEDSAVPSQILLCALDDIATWLRAMPIGNRDPGDEDRS